MESSHEIELVKAFVISRKRERFVEQISSSKRRRKFLAALYHFSDFDPRYVVELAGETDTARGLLEELRRRGAPATCHVLSVYRRLDGRTLDLQDAVEEVFASLEGTILSCVPGRLAYYEGEAPKNRFILDRARSDPTRRR